MKTEEDGVWEPAMCDGARAAESHGLLRVAGAAASSKRLPDPRPSKPKPAASSEGTKKRRRVRRERSADLVPCQGISRKRKTKCKNAALMEYIGPQPTYCFPASDHQVLTNHGFLWLDQVEAHLQRSHGGWGSLRVAGYDAVQGRIVYETPRRLIVNAPTSRAQPWVHFHAKGVNVTVTADHRMYVRSSDTSGIGSPAWTKVPAHTLLSRVRGNNNDSFHMLAAAKGGVKPDVAMPDVLVELESRGALVAFARVYGFLLDSRSLGNEPLDVTLNTCFTHTSPGLRRAASLLRSCLVVAVDTGHSSRHAATHLSSHRVANLLQRSPCGGFAAWVWSLERDPMRALLRGMHEASAGTSVALNHRGSELWVEVAWCSDVLREHVLRAAVHAGLVAKVQDTRHGTLVLLSAEDCEPLVACTTKHVRSTHGQDRTWCFSMPSGFVVARRNHRDGTLPPCEPLVHGNCAEHIDQDPNTLYSKCASTWYHHEGDRRNCKQVVLSELRYCFKHVDQALQGQSWSATAHQLALVERVIQELETNARTLKYVQPELYQRRAKLVPKYTRAAASMRVHLRHLYAQGKAHVAPWTNEVPLQADASRLLGVQPVDVPAMLRRMELGASQAIKIVFGDASCTVAPVPPPPDHGIQEHGSARTVSSSSSSEPPRRRSNRTATLSEGSKLRDNGAGSPSSYGGVLASTGSEAHLGYQDYVLPQHLQRYGAEHEQPHHRVTAHGAVRERLSAHPTAVMHAGGNGTHAFRDTGFALQTGAARLTVNVARPLRLGHHHCIRGAAERSPPPCSPDSPVTSPANHPYVWSSGSSTHGDTYPPRRVAVAAVGTIWSSMLSSGPSPSSSSSSPLPPIAQHASTSPNSDTLALSTSDSDARGVGTEGHVSAKLTVAYLMQAAGIEPHEEA